MPVPNPVQIDASPADSPAPASARNAARSTRPPSRDLLSRVFGLDPRSLALFRVLLGLVLILDLLDRMRSLTAHYTDAGVLPRSAVTGQFLDPSAISLHLISGTFAAQLGLFLLAILFAVGLAIGYRTRLMCFLSWLLLLSLHARNPMIVNAGDDFLRLLLFWSLFVPLGARVSIDSLKAKPVEGANQPIASVGTFALIVQICSVYWFAFAFKQHQIWLNGDAVYYALQVDQYAKPFALWLRDFRTLGQLLTFLTLWIEFTAPWFLFFPYRNDQFRLAAVVMMVGLHTGFYLCFEMGIFPFVFIIAWMVFLPGAVWEFLARRVSRRGAGWTVYFDGDCGFCRVSAHNIPRFLGLSQAKNLPAQTELEILSIMRSENSWVVVDDQGLRHLDYQGFLALCRASFWARWIHGFLSMPLVAWLGTRGYRWVARNRPAFRPRPQKLRLRRWERALVVVLLVYGTLWNLRSLDFSRWVRVFPTSVDFVGTSLGLDQAWSMFAPYPMKHDGWEVLLGSTRDGRVFDLFRDRKRSFFQKPRRVSEDYSHERWRRYHMNMTMKWGAPHRPYYASYLCARWNDESSPRDPVHQVHLYFVRERTEDPGRVTRAEKEPVWLGSYDCF